MIYTESQNEPHGEWIRCLNDSLERTAGKRRQQGLLTNQLDWRLKFDGSLIINFALSFL